jgi:hypothetical protein
MFRPARRPSGVGDVAARVAAVRASRWLRCDRDCGLRGADSRGMQYTADRSRRSLTDLVRGGSCRAGKRPHRGTRGLFSRARAARRGGGGGGTEVHTPRRCSSGIVEPDLPAGGRRPRASARPPANMAACWAPTSSTRRRTSAALAPAARLCLGCAVIAVARHDSSASAAWPCLAPLVPGIVQRCQIVGLAGRRGPPLFTALLRPSPACGRKGVVWSSTASPGTPGSRPRSRGWRSCSPRLLLPLGPAASGLGFRGAALVFATCSRVSRFCVGEVSALETGSAFEGMGAAPRGELRRARRGALASPRSCTLSGAERQRVTLATMTRPRGGRRRRVAPRRRTCSPSCSRRTVASRSTTPNSTSS